MVKVTGRVRGGPGQLKAHLDYITRNSRLQGETQDGERVIDRASLRALHDDWLLANTAEQRGRPSPNATQSVSLILSMPPSTPPDRVEAAARTWARDTLGGKYDYLMARHDDTAHPHVHITVRAVGYDGKRLAPGPDDLQTWRERFAREMRRLGVEAEASPGRHAASFASYRRLQCWGWSAGAWNPGCTSRSTQGQSAMLGTPNFPNLAIGAVTSKTARTRSAGPT